MKQYPSIFNDVIGPVMIGPSSSHTAASVRIGALIRQLAGDGLESVRFVFDRRGSLAATYNTQGSDFGLAGGLLGYAPHEKGILTALEQAEAKGLRIGFALEDVGPGHPNAYYVTAISSAGALRLTAASVGGGMVEVTEVEGFPVHIDGGFYEALLVSPSPLGEDGLALWRRAMPGCAIETQRGQDGRYLHRGYSDAPPDAAALRAAFPSIRLAGPVLPVVNQMRPQAPFVTAEEIAAAGRDKPLWQLAAQYESARSGLGEEAVLQRMEELVQLLAQSLASGGGINAPGGRILPDQAQLLENSPYLGGSLEKKILRYVTRFMELKSAMGVFVAAPTAGSCGCLPGTVFALGDELGLSVEEKAKAMLCAGLIGVLIASKSTFAAEVCGCQAECGAGSGMAAAACAHVLGATAEQGLTAASMALQNILGMVCDPVANRVEVPCLGKNIMAAMNALASANMARAGFAGVIPLDQTIAAMDSVGRSIPRELRCTGLGGLSVTEAAQCIRFRLEGECASC